MSGEEFEQDLLSRFHYDDNPHGIPDGEHPRVGDKGWAHFEDGYLDTYRPFEVIRDTPGLGQWYQPTGLPMLKIGEPVGPEDGWHIGEDFDYWSLLGTQLDGWELTLTEREDN